MPFDIQDSCYWVLLVSGRFGVSKTIIPEAQEHFLTPPARRDTHPFGGLRLKLIQSQGQHLYPSDPLGRYIVATVHIARRAECTKQKSSAPRRVC